MAIPLIDISAFHEPAPRHYGKHGVKGRCCKPMETFGGKTLRRSEWPSEVGLSRPAWYERKRKFLDPNIDFTEEDLLAPPKTKPQARAMRKSNGR